MIDLVDFQERLDRAANLGEPLHLRPKEVVHVRELGREVVEKRAVFQGLLTAFTEGKNPEDCMLRAEAFMRSLSSASGVSRAIAALDLATGRKGS